jgi:hypothetical protein
MLVRKAHNRLQSEWMGLSLRRDATRGSFRAEGPWLRILGSLRELVGGGVFKVVGEPYLLLLR